MPTKERKKKKTKKSTEGGTRLTKSNVNKNKQQVTVVVHAPSKSANRRSSPAVPPSRPIVYQTIMPQVPMHQHVNDVNTRAQVDNFKREVSLGDPVLRDLLVSERSRNSRHGSGSYGSYGQTNYGSGSYGSYGQGPDSDYSFQSTSTGPSSGHGGGGRLRPSRLGPFVPQAPFNPPHSAAMSQKSAPYHPPGSAAMSDASVRRPPPNSTPFTKRPRPSSNGGSSSSSGQAVALFPTVPYGEGTSRNPPLRLMPVPYGASRPMPPPRPLLLMPPLPPPGSGNPGVKVEPPETKTEPTENLATGPVIKKKRTRKKPQEPITKAARDFLDGLGKGTA